MKLKGTIAWLSKSGHDRNIGQIREIIVSDDHIGIIIYDPRYRQIWGHVLNRKADRVSGQLRSRPDNYIADIQDAQLRVDPSGQGDLAGVWKESAQNYDFLAQWDEEDQTPTEIRTPRSLN
jgi:hypothetical protein